MRWLIPLAVCALLIAQAVRPDAGKLFQERKYSEAARLLRTQVADQPGNFSAWMLLGICQQQLGNLADAEKSFLTALRVQPGNSSAYYSLARVRFLLGRFDEAIAAANEALKRGENPARVHDLRGRIEEERGQYEAALAEYRLALSSNRAMAESLSGEASVLYKLGRYPEARSSAQAALRMNPADEAAKNILDRAIPATAPVSLDSSVQPVRFTRKEVIDFRLDHSPSDQKYLISTMAGGLAVFDFDNDGLVDIFFANGADLPSLKKTGPKFWNRLYRNRGNWQFEDVTEKQNLRGEGFSIGAAVADFDNDGRIDLFVPGVKRNLLYRNTSHGFIEISKSAGIKTDSWPIAAAWLDYDRDGWLDLFVVNYLDWTPETNRYCGDRSKNIRVYCHPREYRGLSNQLYRNRGDGTFEDVSIQSGIAKHIGKGMSAAVIDADLDGWPDLFVTNDSEPNFLFHNKGNGTFEELALHFGVALTEQAKPISSMGVDARDYNNDGLPDLAVTALIGENFPIFRNAPDHVFQDATFPSRIGIAAARRSGWGIVLADLNNDGWKDIFTANSHVTDNIEQIRSERYLEPNTIFLNRDGSFIRTQELGEPAAHRGLAVADFDNDGRLDAFVSVLGGKAEFWRNESDAGQWIRLKLEGQSIGARVRIGNQWQERTSASGYASSNLDAVHFGLGAQTEVPEIEIIWSSGQKQVLKNQKAGQILVVREPARP